MYGDFLAVSRLFSRILPHARLIEISHTEQSCVPLRKLHASFLFFFFFISAIFIIQLFSGGFKESL